MKDSAEGVVLFAGSSKTMVPVVGFVEIIDDPAFILLLSKNSSPTCSL